MAISRKDLYKMIEMIPDEKLARVAYVIKKVNEEDDELTLEEQAQIAEAEKRIACGEYTTLEELFEKYGEYDV